MKVAISFLSKSKLNRINSFQRMFFSENKFSHFAVYLTITMLLSLSLLLRCKKLDPERVVKIKTGSITDISYNSCSVDGTILDISKNGIDQYGFCWAVTQNPTIENDKTQFGAKNSTGNFSGNLTGLSPNTIYYVKAYATNSQGTCYGSQLSFTTLLNITIPTVTTTDVTTFTSTSATVGGNVTSDGNATVTDHGVYWGTSQNPESTGTKLQIGSGTGTFSTSLSGLSPNTTYYVKAYATNSQGTGYGNEVSFTTTSTVTDIDGNVYNTVTIGTQVWMAENLKTTKYNDNTSIPLVTDNTAWAALTTSGYCWYNNDAATYKATYGALYNWHTVNTGKLCPTGWHVPTDAEWTTLTTYLGGEGVAGGKLKETGTAHWISPNTGATNETGFTALPGGFRDYNGPCYYIGSYGLWWSSTEYSTTSSAWRRTMHYDNTSVLRDYFDKRLGFSVRCVRDF